MSELPKAFILYGKKHKHDIAEFLGEEAIGKKWVRGDLYDKAVKALKAIRMQNFDTVNTAAKTLKELGEIE